MVKNWYLILELEFDPAENNENIIREAIEKKKKLWTSKRNDLRLGKEYTQYLGSISQIEKDMIGPENKRFVMAKEACNEVYGPIDDLLKALNITEIEENKIEEIARNKKIDIRYVRRRIDFFGIAVINGADGNNEELSNIYEKYYKKTYEEHKVYSAIEELLKTFDAVNLYSFLFLDEYNGSWKNYKLRNIQKQIDERRKSFSKNNSETTSGTRLCTECEKCFKNEDTKKAYDDYLEIIETRKVLNKIIEIAGYKDNHISGDNYSAFLNDLLLIFDSEYAEKVIVSLCKAEKISFEKGTLDKPPRNDSHRTSETRSESDYEPKDNNSTRHENYDRRNQWSSKKSDYRTNYNREKKKRGKKKKIAIIIIVFIVLRIYLGFSLNSSDKLHNVWEMKDKTEGRDIIVEHSENIEYLSNIESTEDSKLIYFEDVKDNLGTSYSYGIGTGFGNKSAEYNLYGKYQKLTGRAVLNFNERTLKTSGKEIFIYGDGNLLFQSEEIKAGVLPQEIDIDVSGVNSLFIKMNGEEIYLVDCFLYTDLNEPVLTTAVPVEYEENEVELKDLVWMNGDGRFTIKENVQDNSGGLHKYAVNNDDNSGYWLEYIINGQFNSIQGTVFLRYEDKDIRSNDARVRIYGDDNVLFESDIVSSGYSPQDFNIDLTGVNKLRVEMKGWVGYPSIANCKLIK